MYNVVRNHKVFDLITSLLYDLDTTWQLPEMKFKICLRSNCTEGCNSNFSSRKLYSCTYIYDQYADGDRKIS